MREFRRLEPPPGPESVHPDEREAYERVVERTARVHGNDSIQARYFGALLNAPPLADVLVRFGKLMREGQLRGSYTDAERELVDMVLATDLGYNGILDVHVPDALAVGVRPEAIEAVRKRREEELTDEERQIVDFSREVINGAVTDDSYAALVERLGGRGALEFTVFVGFLLMTVRLWQALGVPDPTDEEIDELFRRLLDGSMPIPSPDARIG
jgi:alkylhydroperoxidase/carboxymuconolactone decarboxylase family protein YurZ